MIFHHLPTSIPKIANIGSHLDGATIRNTRLDSLSIEDRTIVVFRVVGCLEFSEIAEIVEQKLSAVKMRFKRALEKHAS